MTQTLIAIGSNLGDRQKNLEHARLLLEQRPDIRILKMSSVRETEPVGGPPQGKYLNAVWLAETGLAPEMLLEELLAIEKRMGRERREPNAPRTLDLDILFFGDRIIHRPGLVIPHPRLAGRVFVLEPLAELVPDWMHPKLKKTVRAILEEVLEGHSKS